MLLSVITINKNNKKGLQRTFESIKNQTYTDFEYLVIDGKSTDGSLDLIKSYQSKISYWQSEPDSGIYQAMNKGIAKAKGKYLLFLNSGDTLSHQHILTQFFEAMHADTDIGFFYTDAIFVDNSKQSAWKKSYPDKITIDFLIKNSLCHQSSIIAKSAFSKLGNYDEQYSISSDWMWCFKAFKEGLKFQKISNIVLSNFVLGGFSENYLLGQKEHIDFFKNNYPEYLTSYYNFIKKRSLINRIFLKIIYLFNDINYFQRRKNYKEYQLSLDKYYIKY